MMTPRTLFLKILTVGLACLWLPLDVWAQPPTALNTTPAVSAPAGPSPVIETALQPPAQVTTAPTALPLSPAQTRRLSQLFKSPPVDATTQAAINSALPNTPQQIGAFMAQKNAVDAAKQPNPIQPMQLPNTVRAINLRDNAPPPLLQLVKNYATNVSFVGENGKPWPIENVVPGDKTIVSADQSNKGVDPYNTTLLVQTAWASSNVTFYLKGRVKPIVLFVHTAADPLQGLDSAVNVALDGNPPGTAALPVKNVGVVSDALLNTVDNAPGSAWRRVNLKTDNLPLGLKMWTSPDNTQAIVRVTSGELTSPDWASQASNPDNTVTAYAFDYVPLMLLVNSNDGGSFQVSVQSAVQTLAGQDAPATAQVNNVSALEKAAQARLSHVN